MMLVDDDFTERGGEMMMGLLNGVWRKGERGKLVMGALASLLSSSSEAASVAINQGLHHVLMFVSKDLLTPPSYMPSL
jgi:hypothetical protein